MGQPKVWVAVLGALVVVGSAIYVYPTPYVIAKQGQSDFVRVHRLSGVKEYATDRGWRTMTAMVEEQRAESSAKVMREVELGLVKGYSLNSQTLNVHYRDGREDFVSSADDAGPIIKQFEAEGLRAIDEQLAYK